MKWDELTEEQKGVVAENFPEWVAIEKPVWMVFNRPEWMVENKPRIIAEYRPEWIAEHRPDFRFGFTLRDDVELPSWIEYLIAHIEEDG